MPIVEKENRKEYLSEYVVDVPQLIRNRRNATSYELLQLLGSVSINWIFFCEH